MTDKIDETELNTFNLHRPGPLHNGIQVTEIQSSSYHIISYEP